MFRQMLGNCKLARKHIDEIKLCKSIKVLDMLKD